MGDPADYLQRAATHEAGHTISAVQFGLPIVSVTVEGAPHLHRGRATMPLTTRTELIAIVCLSGPAAEEVYCGPILDRGDAVDLEMARRALRQRYSSELELARELHRHRDAARRLVRSRWAEERIRRIADALVARGTLTADEIYALTS